MRERRVMFALTCALLVAHCAWQRPGVRASFAVSSDDPAGARSALDASGAEHVVDRAVLAVRAISLVPCPGSETSAASLLGPARASAHGESETVLGPLELDLTSDAMLELGALAPLPGRYCDVRIAVSALSVSADGGALVLRAEQDREVLLRIPEQRLDASGREANVTLFTSTSTLLAQLDPSARDAGVDAAHALGAVLRALRCEALDTE